MNDEAQGFPAQCYHPSLGAEVIEGRLRILTDGLRFESASHSLDLPWQDLTVTRGEAGDERLYFRHERHAEWSVITQNRAMLDEPVFSQRTNLRAQVEAITGPRHPMRRLAWITLGFLAVFAAMAWGLWWLGGVAVRAAVARVPMEWEQKLGDRIIKDLRGEATFVEDPALLARVTNAAAPLLRVLPGPQRQFQFHLVEDRSPNAYALPGGHVVVHRGLTNVLTSPEELAGVLAHEIAHVTRRHGFHKIASAAGPFLLARALVGDRQGVLGLLGNGSQLLVRQSFSREYEREADDDAFRTLVAANIDPRGLVQFLRNLGRYDQSKLLEKMRLGAFSSHPPTPERIARLESLWEKLPRKSGFVPLEAVKP